MARPRFVPPRSLETLAQAQKAFRDISADFQALRQLEVQTTIELHDFSPLPNSFQRVSVPTGVSVRCVLPSAKAANRGDQVVLFLERMTGTLVIEASPNQTVNDAGTLTFNTDGVVALWSNGTDAWSGVSQLPVGGSGAPPWSDVLAVGAHSGAHTPIVDAGQSLDFGNPAGPTFPVDGDIRAEAAGGAFKIHSGADLNLQGSQATTVQAEAAGVDVVAATSVHVHPTTEFLVNIAATDRFKILANGEWDVSSSHGTAGQYLRSAGLGATPTWATIAIGELAAIATDTFLGNISGSSAAPSAVALSSIDSTSIIYDAASHTFQLAAGTGDVTWTQNTTATTIAVHAVTNSKLVQMAADTFKGNVTALTADASDVALSSLAGNGLGFASHAFSVNVGPSLAIVTDNVVRAALTGAITATQDSNTTAFGALAAKSVLANATNISAVPAALAGTAAFQHLRVNSANTGLEWSVLTTGDFPANSVPLTALATQAADTFVGNITALTATPVAVPLSSVQSVTVPYDATTHTFRRAALGGDITAPLNTNLTAFRLFNAKSVLVNATNASAVPSDLASSAADQYLRVNAANTALEWGTLPATTTPTWATVLAAGATSGTNSPNVDAGQFLSFGTPSAFSAGSQINSTTGITVKTDAGGITLAASATGALTFTGQTWSAQVSAAQNFHFDSGGALEVAKAVSIASTPTSGNGAFWARNENTNSIRPMFTRTTASGTVDYSLDSEAKASASTAAVVSASTAVLNNTTTLTLEANSLVVGSSFGFRFKSRFVRGATATALNIGCFLTLGANAVSFAIGTSTTALTGDVVCEGTFTVLSTGTGGTASAELTAYSNVGAGSAFAFSSAANAALPCNTTIALACNGTSNMNTAVSGTTLTNLGGFIYRIR